ncbi:MAG TPA: BamA/TamA family outer membrane protein [Blastocatellia bacterium]|nr:BamA/TamA family outer membrane protein [Blastocatellia bacterium]
MIEEKIATFDLEHRIVIVDSRLSAVRESNGRNTISLGAICLMPNAISRALRAIGSSLILVIFCSGVSICYAQEAGSGAKNQSAVASSPDLQVLPNLAGTRWLDTPPLFDLPQSTQNPSGQSSSSGLSSFASGFKTKVRNAPQKDNWVEGRLGTDYVKVVIGGFEQDAGLGLGLRFTTANKLPGVELSFMALTSTRLYRRFEGEVYVPKIGDGKTHADFWFDYLRRTKDTFFGIGSAFPKSFQTDFDLEQRNLNGLLYRDFTERLQAGLYAKYSNSSTYRGQDTNHIPIDHLFSGALGAVPAEFFAPGLLTDVKILSYGMFAALDLRDDSKALTRGAYLYGRFGNNQGVDVNHTFGDYGWLEGELDARGYIPLGGDKTSLAVRGHTTLKDPHGGSQIPFYDLSFYGGNMYGRGFINYRLRGNNMVLFSTELRRVVWVQSETKGLDIFGFGDTGQVWGDNRSKTDPLILANQDFSNHNWRAGIGGGFEYRFSPSFAGRIAIAHSVERNLIYLSFGKGF